MITDIADTQINGKEENLVLGADMDIGCTRRFRHLADRAELHEILALLRQHVKETLTSYITFSEDTYVKVTDGFIHEDLKSLRKAMSSLRRAVSRSAARRRR